MIFHTIFDFKFMMKKNYRGQKYNRLFIDSQGCRCMSASVDVCLILGIENGKLRVENSAKRSKSVQYFKIMDGSHFNFSFSQKKGYFAKN